VVGKDSMKIWNKKSIRWTVVLIVVVLAIGTVSLWSILSRHTNQEKTYTGAIFIRTEAENAFRGDGSAARTYGPSSASDVRNGL
jgi:predicted negative regulator of RcsB-dependent stress response